LFQNLAGFRVDAAQLALFALIEQHAAIGALD
jgi:hypothetical protein